MKIYIAHSQAFDFKNELYAPLKSIKDSDVELVFPHDSGSEPFNSKQLFNSKQCAFILAEVSDASTGLGIELGWADALQIPIYAIHRKGALPSGAIKVVAKCIEEYETHSELLSIIQQIINKHRNN